MKMLKSFQICAATLALTLAGAASATTALTNEYTVSANATNVGANTWTFDYSVLNNNQGIGGLTGLDGFTIFIPVSATVVSSNSPVTHNGPPGYWQTGSNSGLDLGGDNSQNLAAPAGYTAYSWWGIDEHSVYTPGSTASFSITLSNVNVGSNTAGLTTYFGYGTATAPSATNQYGSYSTFTGTFAAPIAAVPEPETYAMMLAGLGLVGFMSRRKKAAKKAAV